ncbi:hypothetical protein PVMG_05087 [Plasmodium vivax Mauritania I]|uniref:VIR protein n=1 Tax=Plasmodium vivax Mauritania I TaxID=1035515 RepID=A0A0J9TIX2_PLAVI|nr:hypothetical protein PVMG_05087 [Plasmodium vivax Mauritania I]
MYHITILIIYFIKIISTHYYNAYFSYNDYTKVRNKLNKCNYNYENEERFDKILSRITNKNAVNWNDKIFACLHNYLTYHNGFMPFSVKDYCRYINFWLNGEVRESGNEKFQSHFNSFKDFANNYAFVQQKHYRDSCEKYIHKIEDGHYGRMKYLYEFYDLYDNLRSQYYWVNEEACKKVPDKTFKYNQAIEFYYDKYPNLYKNISYVKDLIENLLEKTDSKCKKSEKFRIPPKFLEAERIRKQQEDERIRKQQEDERIRKQKEDERIRKQQEDERIRKQQLQQELVSQRGMQQMHTTHDAEGERFHQREQLLSSEQDNSIETVNLGAQERSNLLRHRLILSNSGRYEDSQEPALGQLYEDQLGKRVHTPGNEDTRTEGSYIGSSGFPGYITEVFRSVEPAPILGVSGGMGALFLLFKVFIALKIYLYVSNTFK